MGNAIRIIQIIWGALLGTQCMYVGLLFGPLRAGAPSAGVNWLDFSDPMRAGLVGMALLVWLLSFALPEWLLSRWKKIVPGDGQDRVRMVTVSFVPLVVRYALLEAVTIFGFVLAFTRHEPGQILPFFALAGATMLVQFPSQERIESKFRS